MMKLKHSRTIRQRGSMLVDAGLAIVVMMTMFAYITKTTDSERKSQNRMIVAAEHDIILAAARNFVASRYDDIRQDLYDEADTSGKAILSYSMSDLIDEGFLPDGYEGNILKEFYDQDYALIVRAVDASDSTTPKSTMTYAQLNASGAIDPVLLDGSGSNGEMKIESVLASYGGIDIARGQGGDILAALDSSFGGYVVTTGTSSGLYASFDMDITKFSGEDTYPTSGHLASVVSLSDFGVIGLSETEEATAASTEGAFLRCDGLGEPEYSTCVASNDIYSDIVFQPYDTDSDGTNDVFPALRNVTILDCGNDTSVVGVENQFTINCGTTNMTGDLDVAGDLSVSDINASGSVTADDVTINGFGAEAGDASFSLSQTILNSEIVVSGSDFPMPECAAGSPQLSLTPVSYIIPASGGNARIIGVYPEASAGTGKWTTSLVLKLLRSGNTISNTTLSGSEGKLLAQSWCE
jgi:hypothetical protein